MDELVKAMRRNKPMTWDDYCSCATTMKLAIRVARRQINWARTKANGQTVEDTTVYGVTANIGDMKQNSPRRRYIRTLTTNIAPLSR